MENIKATVRINKIVLRNVGQSRTIAKVKFIECNQSLDLAKSTDLLIGDFVSINVGDVFDVEGYFSTDNKYGTRFIETNNNKVMPSGIFGIQVFLTNLLKINSSLAEKIIEKFKYETFSIIENSPLKLVEIKGITEKKALIFNSRYQEYKRSMEILIFLNILPIARSKIISVYKDLKNMPLDVIKQNPYLLMKYKDISFQDVDQLASRTGYPINGAERISSGIMHILENNTKQGHLYFDKTSLIKDSVIFLNNSFGIRFKNKRTILVNENEVRNELEKLIENEKVFEENDCIYPIHCYQCEKNISKKISMLMKLSHQIKQDPDFIIDVNTLIKDIESSSGIRLDEKQKAAIEMGIINKLSILTGGPGTGKTQTIRVLLKCIEEVGEQKVLLLAPTGRAAKRMSELTEIEAQTIHRALGIQFDEETELKNRDAADKISDSFIIIDEFSMVDIYLFNKFLNTIDLNTCSLLLIGDSDQLPSIGPGQILQDLINTNIIPSIRLTMVFRQNSCSQIANVANAVLQGNIELSTYNKDISDFHYVYVNDANKINSQIITTINDLQKKDGYRLQDIQVLSPVKNRMLGVNYINQSIQNTFNKTSKDKEFFYQKKEYTECFKIGDKVIQTSNNYELNVFNGEMGVIINAFRSMDDTIHLDVDFEGKTIRYEGQELEDVELAYAITIHKSQGSEYPVVIIPIVEFQKNMLNRNLIYTAITRAKDKCIIIGNKEIIEQVVKENPVVMRNSKLTEKIKNNFVAA